MNSMTREPLKAFEAKQTDILATLRPRTVYVLKVMGTKVKVTETFCGEGIENDGCPSKTILMNLVRLFICCLS